MQCDKWFILKTRLFQYSDEVRAALDAGKAVVALESTIISHGLPYPDNEKLATELEDIVRAHGGYTSKESRQQYIFKRVPYIFKLLRRPATT